MATRSFGIGLLALIGSTILGFGASSHASTSATPGFARSKSLPGLQRGSAPLVSPETARQVLTWSHSNLGGGGAETETTPEIQELARGLRFDPLLIYEYVRNTIDYVPQFGSVRSATQTMHDRRGNDFDQTSLLIALMRESGFTATYLYGRVRVNAATISGMLGVAPNANVVGGILGSAGIPATIFVNGAGNLTFVEMDHVWAKVNIGGIDRVFDPSVKSYVRTTGINLASAMQYDQSTFLADAKSGATLDPTFIQNANHANIAADFATYTTNLSDEIRSMSGPKLKDVVGGKEIVQLRNQAFVSTLPYELSRDFNWVDVPSTFQTKLAVQHLGINETLAVPAIYGKRLTITYNGSNAPELKLDGTILATGSPVSPGSFNSITLTADHPYAAFGGTYADQSTTRTIKAGGTYVLVNGWAEPGRDIVDKHKRIALENSAAGNPDGSEPVLGETLTVIALTWLGEVTAATNLLDDVGLTTTIQHHVVGFCGQNDSPFVDLPLGFVSVISNTNTPADEDASFFVGAGISSAFEWGVFDQLQEVSAVCTVKLVDISSGKGDKIFNATNANFTSVVSPQLVNYSAGEKALVQSYTNAGYRVILPQDGDLGEGNWKGVGFLAISPDESQIGHIISGALSGGEGIFAYLLDPEFAGEEGYLGFDPFGHELSFEPIDLVRGDYLLDTRDLSLGNGAMPFELDFARHYSSGARAQDGSLGRGWTHNFNHVLRGIDSDGFKGLGEESPLDAVPGIVELYVALDLLNGPKDLDRLLIGTVAHRWFMDRLIKNLVVFEEGATTNRYLKMPDGSYVPPAGSADALSVEFDGSYHIDRKQGVTIDFNTAGQIESWTDRNSNAITFTYAGDHLTGVQNQLGRSFSFTYTGDRITQVSDGAGGRSVQYQYDVDGNLTTYTDPIANNTTYSYDEPGRMTQMFYPANPADAFVTNEYDPFGRVMKQRDGNSNEYEYFYAAGARTEEEDPLGNSKAWHFDARGKTTLEIDALNRETSHVYDGQRRLAKSTFPELNAILREYDARHNETKVTIQPKPGSGQTNTVKSFTYDPVFDQLTSMTDQQGRVTTYDYDSNGNLITKTRPKVGGRNPAFTYTNNSRGQVLTETDPEGMVTRYNYDAASGNLMSIKLDDGGLELTNSMTYDAMGDVLTTTNPLGETTTMTYDDRRLIDDITSPAPFHYIHNYEYDANGRLTRDERQTGLGPTPWQTTDFTYTLSGKKATSTNPQGHVSSWEYDELDRVSRFTDAELNPVDFTYDAAGQLFRVVNSLGQNQEEYTWYPNGAKASLKDAKGNLTSFTYDGFDKLKRETHADGSFEQYTYDAVGNTLTKRVRSGVTITYTYDALDRLSSKQVPGSAQGTLQYTYDKVGRLVDATDATGTIHHDYDSAGRLSLVTRPDGQAVGSQYDAACRRTRVTHPDGYFATYEYDTLGRLTNVRENGAALIVHYDYDPLDRRTGASYGNGTSTAYAREIDDNVISIDHVLNGSSVGVAYTYDLVGNRLTRTDAAGLHTFTYDDDYRLLGVDQPGDDVSYVYDAAGNRISETVGASTTSYTTNLLNQYTSVGGVEQTYNANGCLTDDGALRYAFDAENRLRRVYAPEFTVDYQYDVFGRRIAKSQTASPMLTPQSHTQHALVIDAHPPVDSRTSYVYDGNQVILERDGETGAVLRRFVYGTYIDEPVLMKSAAGNSYFHTDAVGSVLAMSNAAGAAIDTFSYTPYGRVDDAGTTGNPYFFTGRQLDGETGLYFHRARYYDPRTGRFLSPDPIGFAGGTNLYAYAANSPQMFIDPLGLDWLDNLSNFSAGFGDSLTFGLTGVVRGWMGVDDVVDRNSGWYRGGEYTEVAVEVTLTLGSAALKQGAKEASREIVRAEYRAYTREIAREGNELHHIQPLFGHPGGAPTLFPTGGLPVWMHSSSLNTQLLDRAAHLAAHSRLIMLENGAVVVVNPLMTGLRLFRDLFGK